MARVAPATIRHNNPGAMYPGKSARKFRSAAASIIGGGHQIATFPTKTDGAAALFDLLARVYSGLTLEAALTKWSGGNNVKTYVKRVTALTGLSAETILSKEIIETPASGVALAKAMARHETGKEYPMSDAEWAAAHALAFPSTPAVASTPYEMAKMFIGTREIKGSKDNPEIMRWYEDAGNPQPHDEVPNCSAFVCSMLQRTDRKNPKTLLARDHLNAHEAGEGKEGEIVVISRGRKNSWTGHVGFLARDFIEGDKKVAILGANQGDETNITEYAADRVLGFRKPVSAVKPILATVNQSRTLKATLNALGVSVAAAGSWIYDQVSSLWGSMPSSLDMTEQLIATGQRLFALMQINWPVSLTISSTIVILSYTFLRGLRERRVA